MDWNKIGENALSGTIRSAAGSAFGGLIGMAAQRSNYKYQKKLMAEQWKYQQMAFKMENERQNWLMQNSAAIAKAALKQAGYSTADPNGTGTNVPVTSSMDSPSQPGTQIDIASHALQGAQLAASTELMHAQAKKTETETDYQKMYNELYSIYGESTMKATLENLNEDVKLKVATTLKTDQDRLNSIKMTEASVKEIEQHLEMDWQKLEPTVKLMAAQAYEAEQKGNLDKASIAKVWQDIRESNARIQKLMSDIQLNNAQIGVAFALVENYAADTGFKKASTRKVNAEKEGQIIENRYNRLVYDVKNGLGVEWNQAREVIQTFIPFAGSAAVLNK